MHRCYMVANETTVISCCEPSILYRKTQQRASPHTLKLVQLKDCSQQVQKFTMKSDYSIPGIQASIRHGCKILRAYLKKRKRKKKEEAKSNFNKRKTICWNNSAWSLIRLWWGKIFYCIFFSLAHVAIQCKSKALHSFGNYSLQDVISLWDCCWKSKGELI